MYLLLDGVILRMPGLQERQQQGKSRKEALHQALQSGQRLIIDLDFQDSMSGSELKSLCKQLVYCWSANLKVCTLGLQSAGRVWPLG